MLNIFMYPYFLLGFYFGKHEKQLLRTLRAAEIGSLALFPILFLFYEKKHFIYTTGIIGTAYGLAEYILIDSFRWVIGLAGSLFAICICRLVVSLCDRFSPGKVFSSGIQLLGRKSLQVYILSTGLVSYYLPKLIRCLSDQGMSFNMPMLVYDCVFTLLLAAFYAIVLLLINKVLEKTGLSKILFGR